MYIRVLVQTGKKRETFVQRNDTAFVITVREPAERNLANTRVIEMIADYYAVAVQKVRIISGHHNPQKMLSVDIPDRV